MRITINQLRQIIREELVHDIDEMALAKTTYYHDIKNPALMGISPPHRSRERLTTDRSLPNNLKYMQRAKMQLERFPLPVNVIWLEGTVNDVAYVPKRSLHDISSPVGQVFSLLFEKKYGNRPNPNDFNILISSDSTADIRGPEGINYSIYNSFHQLFDAGPFEIEFSKPLISLAYDYVERVAPDIAASSPFQDAKFQLENNFLENFGDYDQFFSESYSKELKQIFSKIFKGRTIRLGLATFIREICNEALNVALTRQINTVKVESDPENSDILMKMSRIVENIPQLATVLSGKTLYAGF